MDDEGNDIDDIFEEYENDEHQERTADNEGDTNTANETQNAERIPVPKRIVKNPRLKFNAERLCGERGIPVIMKHFKDVKFKGKGHEVEDLNKLMSSLEHWCHRLYPSMKFGDCLRQIEKLGKKRPVQTCLRKIRMDMPILNSDFVRDDEEEEPDRIENELDIEIPPQDAFDRLISETQEATYEPLASTPLPVKIPVSIQTLGSVNTLTDEQRKRMEYNKLLATERRKAKWVALQSSDLVNQSEELFTGTQSSATVDEVTNDQENFSASDHTESTLLLGHQAVDRSVTSAKESNSEELELDDLVDLVDEEEPQIIIDKNETSHDVGSHHKQVNEVNLTDRVKSTCVRSNASFELIDLENEIVKNVDSVKRNKVEFIDLESKITYNSQRNAESIELIDLDNEKVNNLGTNSRGENEVIELDNEDTLRLIPRIDIASPNGKSDSNCIEQIETGVNESQSCALEMDIDGMQTFPNGLSTEELDLDNPSQSMDVE